MPMLATVVALYNTAGLITPPSIGKVVPGHMTTKTSYFTRPLALLLMWATLAALAAVALVAVSPAARAAGGDCQPSGSQVGCTFSYTGAAQSWTVPEGVTQATFDVYGAGGGGASTRSFGGRGGGGEGADPLPPRGTAQMN